MPSLVIEICQIILVLLLELMLTTLLDMIIIIICYSFLFQEYERAVIFRLGLLLSGGARGPGVFFVIPCVDHYQKIDMRTQTYDVPPQEVKTFLLNPRTKEVMSASFYRF